MTNSLDAGASLPALANRKTKLVGYAQMVYLSTPRKAT